MRLRTAVMGAALLICVGVALAWHRNDSWPADEPPNTLQMPGWSARLVEATQELEFLVETTRDNLQQASRLSRLHAIAPPPRDREHDSSTSNEIDWPRDLPRTNFDLVRYAVKHMERLETKLFVRHTRLNPNDIPVSERAEAELDSRVSAINTALHELNQRYRHVRSLEMMEQIDAGRIQPREDPADDPPRPVPRPVREFAERKALERGTSVEEEIASLGLQYGRGHGESALFYKGASYRLTAFDSLPATESALQAVNYFAYESLVTIGSWFVARGLLPAGDLAEALGSAPPPTVSELMKRIPHRSR